MCLKMLIYIQIGLMQCVMLQNHTSFHIIMKVAGVCEHPKLQAKPTTESPSVLSIFLCGLWVILWICKVIESDGGSSSIHACDCFFWPWPFLRTPSLQFRWHNTPLHYTDDRVSLKVWLPTIMCDAGALQRIELPIVPLNFRRKRKVAQKETTMFLSFVLYVDNSSMLHVEWQTIEYASLCYTMVAISALYHAQHKKTGQTIILGELLRQISQDHTKIVQGWLNG